MMAKMKRNYCHDGDQELLVCSDVCLLQCLSGQRLQPWRRGNSKGGLQAFKHQIVIMMYLMMMLTITVMAKITRNLSGKKELFIQCIRWK